MADVTEPVPWTDYLRSCTNAAEEMAGQAGGPVEVEYLLVVAAFNDDRESRSRLVLRALGAHHFFEDEGYDHVAEVFGLPERFTVWTPEAEAVLGRLAYWVSRTGDYAADTAHLLLACLEAGSAELTDAGVTPRDAVRAAVTVRRDVSLADRQPRERGPILSGERVDRPVSYEFTARWEADAGPRRARHFQLRSQGANTAGMGSTVQFHITLLHVVTLTALGIVSVVTLIGIAGAALTVTWWSLLWLASQLARRAWLPIAARVFVDALLVVVSVPLGIPWWLSVLAVPHRVLDILEGRLGLLEVRGETADPDLTESDVRSDLRINVRAGGFYSALRLRGELSNR
ncbi:hypothetical protein [Promicromonospora sp. NFX87]|uniref:hypothetical protein n=1 Tax=Promicromonospora sp. NFX87 TaxID=3402691 RepID=UPI003AFA99AF